MIQAIIGINKIDTANPVKVPEIMKVQGKKAEFQKGLPLEKANKSPVYAIVEVPSIRPITSKAFLKIIEPWNIHKIDVTNVMTVNPEIIQVPTDIIEFEKLIKALSVPKGSTPKRPRSTIKITSPTSISTKLVKEPAFESSLYLSFPNRSANAEITKAPPAIPPTKR
jgi:hypothetical protein